MKIAFLGAGSPFATGLINAFSYQGADVTAIGPQDDSNAAVFCPADLSNPSDIEAAADLNGAPFDVLVTAVNRGPSDMEPGSILATNLFGVRAWSQGMADQMAVGGVILHIVYEAGAGWFSDLEMARLMLSQSDRTDADLLCEEYRFDAERAYALSQEALALWAMTGEAPNGARMNALTVNDPGPKPDAAAIAPVAEMAAFLAGPASVSIDRTNISLVGHKQTA